MNLNSIFKTNEDRERAIASMTALSNDPNWKFLIDNILKPDIEETAMFILDTKFNDLQQENELKKKKGFMDYAYPASRQTG